jgi:hypothetical protein
VLARGADEEAGPGFGAVVEGDVEEVVEVGGVEGEELAAEESGLCLDLCCVMRVWS